MKLVQVQYFTVKYYFNLEVSLDSLSYWKLIENERICNFLTIYQVARIIKPKLMPGSL